jgi:hypothetical protein
VPPHIVLKAVDPDLPSTLSGKVINGVLRGEMGFRGVVITDSLQMGAIRDTWGVASYAQTQVWGPPPPANMTVLKAIDKVVFGAQPGGKLPVTVSARYPYGLGLRY